MATKRSKWVSQVGIGKIIRAYAWAAESSWQAPPLVKVAVTKCHVFRVIWLVRTLSTYKLLVAAAQLFYAPFKASLTHGTVSETSQKSF